MKILVSASALALVAGTAAADWSLSAAPANATWGKAPNLTFNTRTDSTFNIGGVNSWDAEGDASNDVGVAALGANRHVTGIGWDTILTTTAAGPFGGSWGSEAVMSFGSTAGPAVYLTVYFDQPNPVANLNYSNPIVDLVGLGFDFFLQGDGLLVVEFFESFDDAADEIDANWLQGSSITVRHVPAPASLGLMAIGGLVATRRRR